MTATNSRTNTGTTTAQLEIPPPNATPQHPPEFLRLPAPGQRCAWTGLSRSAINEWILPTPRNSNKPPVRSFVLRQKGAKTGIRLVDYSSLRSHILAHPEDGKQGDETV
jgi:hypothetical protein